MTCLTEGVRTVLNRISLKTRLLASFLLLSLVVMLVSFGAIYAEKIAADSLNTTKRQLRNAVLTERNAKELAQVRVKLNIALFGDGDAAWKGALDALELTLQHQNALTAAIVDPKRAAKAEQIHALTIDYEESVRRIQDARRHARSDSAEVQALIVQARDLAQSIATQADELSTMIEENGNAAIAAADANLKFVAWLAPAIGAIGVALAAVFTRLATATVTVPLTRMTVAMTDLANGDTAPKLSGESRSDEIGQMARAIEVFRRDAIEKKRLEGEQENERAAAAASRRDALLSMATTVEAEADATAADITGLTAEMTDTASRMQDVAVKTSANATESLAAAADARSGIEIVAAASQELNASIAEIASQLDSAQTQAHSAVVASQSAQDAVSELSDAAAQIGSVVELISEIASQTNLLALNASIEAARAGEAGRGFAVVAGEVKTLASQTARATIDIGGQIASIRGVTDKALAAMSRIVSIITEVEVSASAISAAVEEQSAATGEIARSVNQTAGAAGKVSALMEGLAAIAAQSRDLSNDVAKDGARVTTTISTLRHAIGRIIRNASPEVNRRQDSRFGVFVDCRVVCGGREHDAVISNVSAGGVCLVSDEFKANGSGPATGQKINMRSAQLGGALTLRVVASSGQRLHLALDRSCRLSDDVIARVAKEGTLALLRKAQSDHEAFVAGVMTVLAGKASSKAADLTDHHTCRLGKWYDSVSDERLLSCSAYPALVGPHKRVHDAGKRAVTAHWANDRAAAEKAAEELKQASREVIALLGQMASDVEGGGRAATRQLA
jgi:methyl-accepting chemotaxis protein